MPRPPYMMQLCRWLFNVESEGFRPDVCSNWMYEALDHCTAVLAKKPGCQKLWSKLLNLKQFVFPDQLTSLLSNKMPISVHLHLLGPTECQELANQIVLDYIHHIPRYVSLLHENRNLWQILRGLLGVLVIGASVAILAWLYNTMQVPVKKESRREPSIHDLLLRKNLHRIHYETKHLSVVPLIDPNLLRCGCPAIGLQVNAKQLCHIKAILLKSTMRDNPADGDTTQTQSLAKLQKFFQHPGKYRIVVCLDLTEDDQESQKASPSTARASAIPLHRRMGIRRRQ